MAKTKIIEVEKEFLEYYGKGYKYSEISELLGVSKSAISTYVAKNGLIHPSKINNVNHEVFNTIVEESAYWLGFLWADGSIQNDKKNATLDLEITDKEHAVKFKEFIGANKITIRDRKNSVTYRVTVSSRTLINSLVSLGFDSKDNRIRIPNIGNEFIFAFLRGYFDGDGHIRVSKNGTLEGIDISGRIELMTEFEKEFNFFSRSEFHSKHSKRIYTNKENGLLFLKTIYKNANIYLERKYNSALLLCE